MTAALQIQERLTVDEECTLGVLRVQWGAVYAVDYDGRRWRASRKGGTGETLRGLTPDDLNAALRSDWADW